MKASAVAVLFLFVSFITFAQSGKLSGKITDFQTGEPLVGANILINGTSLGAATNVNGEYTILNIPPNIYTITAKYVGYRDITQSNIRVSVNLTTQLFFALPSSAYELDVIEIVAEKPLININLTNSTTIINAEDMDNLPVRGVTAIVAAQAGVVTLRGYNPVAALPGYKGDNIYIRGGRLDEVAYYVDGVLVSDPLYGGVTNMGIQNAVQEIQLQAGGYPAEYGGANSGIISTTTKTGNENLKISLEAITDNFGVGLGKKFLGTYTTGYSEYVLTASGPLLDKNIRFFIAGSNIFRRSPAGFHRGMNFKGVYNPSASEASRDTFDIIYPEGYRLNEASNKYQLQGNVFIDFNPLTLKLSGSYLFSEARNGVGYQEVNTFDRAGLQYDETITASIKLTHVLSNKAFYDLIVNYFSDFYLDMDPLLKNNITAYGDSVINAELGTTLKGDGQLPVILVAYSNGFIRSPVPYNNYRKMRSESMGGQINLLYQIGQHHEIKSGFDFKRYTFRSYAIDPVEIALKRRLIPEPETGYDIYGNPFVNNYGYDVYGNKYDGDGLEAPKHPVFASYYMQDKIEYSDLIINAGLRLDYIDIKSKEFDNPHNVRFDSEDQLDLNYMKDTKPAIQISPRLGVAFPVTDKVVFHAHYGKFIQQSMLRDVYQGYNCVAWYIKNSTPVITPVGFGLKPEKTTQYEIGFKQQIGDNFAFDITWFYKDIKDQVQIRSIYADEGARHQQYYSYINTDFSTVKGIELKLDLRRTKRISAAFDYTYSDAQGTGSNPTSSFRQIYQAVNLTPFFPQQIAPLDFNQAHTAFLNVDYRFAADDGPTLFGSKFLSRAGVNILFSIKSGHNYTRWDDESFSTGRRFPIEALNTSTTPWTYQIDLRIDKTFKLGPLQTGIFLWIENVLNTQNIFNVFNVSGDPYDDGFFVSRTGAGQLENIRNTYGDEKAEQFKSLYTALNYNYNNFGQPRQIRLGVRLGY